MVKEEIYKLLKTGFIYPVINLEWVLFIVIVSKKVESRHKGADPSLLRLLEAKCTN